MYEAKKCFGLKVLDYIVTSNYIHLLVLDGGGRHVIPESLKLIAGRTGQEFNQSKKRKGAFWKDRYHATAVDSQLSGFDNVLNMTNGVVDQSIDWVLSNL